MIRLDNIKKRKVPVLFIGLAFLGFNAVGQGFTLKQCIEYAHSNNGDLHNAQYDLEIAQKKVNEQIGSMLPQVDVSGSYTDNMKLSTTAMPGELVGGNAGETVAITMGTQHNLSAEASLTQNILDPTFGVALKAAKITKQQSEQTFRQTLEQVVYNISVTYYKTLVIQKETDALKATLDASTESLVSTELKYNNGMAKKIDVDKIRVSCNNSRSSLQQSELSYQQSLNNLKYYMGMPVDSIIALSDTALSESSAEIIRVDDFNVENHIDYKLQQTSLSLYEANKQKEVAGYLPTLSFNAFYDYNAMRNKFNFLKSGQDWYNSYGLGVTLSIPVFDGLQRKNRISQSKLEIKKAEENILLTSQSLKVNLSNYEIEYRNAVDNIKNEKDNMDLAKNVYDNTQLAYQQGTVSSLELVQAESSYREAQSNYFNKLLNLYIARIELEKSKGNLIEYVNNIK
jgi:outer membrane protein TolC